MANADRPWSVLVRIEDVPETGLHLDLAADERTRRAIARLAGVNALPRLVAAFDVARRGHELRVVGQVCATVGQTCVVSLDPVENIIEEPVDLVFAPPRGEEGPREGKLAASDAAGQTPEALIEGCADLGAVATEFLLLGIDPYPRKPGAVFAAPAADEAGRGPFAALAALNKRPKGDG